MFQQLCTLLHYNRKQYTEPIKTVDRFNLILTLAVPLSSKYYKKAVIVRSL